MKQPELLVNSPATAASKSKRRMASLPAPYRDKTAAPTAAAGLEGFIGYSGKKLEGNLAEQES
jgi:hypothetical protein